LLGYWCVLNRFLSTLCLASFALVATSCADSGSMLTEADSDLIRDIVSGQTLVFVGTDPKTLRSDIYLVRAVADQLAGGEPDLRDAEDFQVEPLGALTESNLNGSVVQDEADQLFPVEAPFVVPDEEGLRVLATSLAYDDEGIAQTGRLVLVNITPLTHKVSPVIEGLQSARFTWSGDYLVLQLRDPVTGLGSLSVVPADQVEDDSARFDLGPQASLDVTFEEPIRDSNRFLARVVDPLTSRGDILQMDPETEEVTVLTAETDLSAGSPRLSPDGTLLAVTLQADATDDESLRRQIAVFDIVTGGPPVFVTGDETVDCGRPAWSPPDGITAQPVLAYACGRLDNGRPDLYLWQSEDGAGEPIKLTRTTQAEVPGGSIDGLVLRAGPLWDPSGQRLVFGASTEQQALEGEGMTLLAFPLSSDLPLAEQDPQAYTVYPSAFGAADWVHFSAGSATPVMMLWDRGETGLEDTRGGHPIEVVSVEADGGLPRAVALGVDLRVSFPVFLGRNTLFYR
jgi:hypothetical protein